MGRDLHHTHATCAQPDHAYGAPIIPHERVSLIGPSHAHRCSPVCCPAALHAALWVCTLVLPCVYVCVCVCPCVAQCTCTPVLPVAANWVAVMLAVAPSS